MFENIGKLKILKKTKKTIANIYIIKGILFFNFKTMQIKRLVISSILGLVFGFVCLAFASSNGEVIFPIAASIVSGRMLIGVAIWLSKFHMKHWSIHGLVMGLIFSLPNAFGAMSVVNPDFSPMLMFSSTVIMGMIYGFLIEFITSVLFKAKMR